jgi:4-amino-4-deoxy-L-arabinose transferase-like glycosyltransferase
MAFSVFRYVQTSKNGWLYVFGVAAGLGLLSKYSTAFYAGSILAGLAITRHRAIFLNRHFYFAGIVAFLIFLPNLLWQYTHNFPIIHHMQELQEEQLQFITPLNFIISQLMMTLPFLFIWVGGLLFVLLSKQGRSYRLFAWAYIAVIGLLVALHGKDYYALGAYPVLFALGGYYLEKITTKHARWTRYIMIAVPVLLCIWVMPLVMPMFKPEGLAAYYKKMGFDKTGALQWEDQQQHPLPQDFADMIGWREMTVQLAKQFQSLPPAEQRQTMIYARGYFTAGALNYYGKDLGLPEVYSDNASFLFWMPEKYNIKNLLLVGHRMPGKDDEVFQQFEKVRVMDSVNMPLFREDGMKFILFENGNDSLNSKIETGVAELKREFQRDY